ncbi:MAG TPA: substrate-binding domain-containing protein [Burkholderiaceae bacterium]|nr:substrate-binding domain-containing protein [Burkholderiaceae bacterium]
MQQRKVRIHDVAKLAGVSVGSASRVINDAANVSPTVRAKVEQAIDILGYAPSHAARTLRSRVSKTVGCLFSDVTNPLYARAFRAIEESLRSDGYMLLLANGLNEVEREIEILRMFQQRGMDGVIYAPSNENDPRIVELVESLPMPVVLYDREIAARADAVLFDHSHGVQEVCRRLFEFGHRRIALALWDAGSRPVRHRIAGYRAAYREAGLPVPELILTRQSSTGSVFEDLFELLGKSDPPTALLAQGTHILVSALRAIVRTGRRIPQDFSVVGIGDTDFTQTYEPAISVMRTPTELVAARAKDLLLDRVSGRVPRQAPSRHCLVPYQIIDRDSWGPVLPAATASCQ